MNRSTTGRASNNGQTAKKRNRGSAMLPSQGPNLSSPINDLGASVNRRMSAAAPGSPFSGQEQGQHRPARSTLPTANRRENKLQQRSLSATQIPALPCFWSSSGQHSTIIAAIPPFTCHDTLFTPERSYNHRTTRQFPEPFYPAHSMPTNGTPIIGSLHSLWYEFCSSYGYAFSRIP